MSTFRSLLPSFIAALTLTSAVSAAPAAASPGRLRVAGAQIHVTTDVDANVAALTRAIEFAQRERADVLVTPEGSLSGYTPEFDAKATQRALGTLLARAKAAGIALVLGTCFESEDGRRYNAQRFYTSSGDYLGFHAKILLCRRMSEPEGKGEVDCFQTRALRTFQFAGLTVGGLVCNDYWANPEWTPMADPHLARQLSEMGARVIFVSANTRPKTGEAAQLGREYHMSNIRMRARAASTWVVVVNAGDPVGFKGEPTDVGPRQLPAPSGLVDPNGEWKVLVPSAEEQFFLCTIELKSS
jgi:predicted amidohydrolase